MSLFDSYLAYCATVFLATIIPGPSMMIAFSHGVRYGVRRAIFTALGNMVASLLQALIALLVILRADMIWTGAFAYIQLLGALYLGYLGFRLMQSRAALGMEEGDGSSSRTSPFLLFWQGFAVAIFNPKAILFFSSLFPQFVRPDQNLGALLSSVLPPICVISVLGFLIYARLGMHISRALSCHSIGRHLNTMIGLLFIVLGVMGLLSVKQELKASLQTEVRSPACFYQPRDCQNES